jgi:hypothetical protein
MRRKILFLVFIVVSIIAKAQFTVFKPAIPNNSRSTQSAPRSTYPFTVYKPAIPDNSRSRSTPIVPQLPNYSNPFTTYTPAETVVTGKKINAVVFYESSTGHEATYRLPVIVNNGSVNKIIFNDNGGCVHIGINNSGHYCPVKVD